MQALRMHCGSVNLISCLSLRASSPERLGELVRRLKVSNLPSPDGL